MTRAELIFNILSEFECQKVLPNLLYDDNYFKPRALSVASFGCGPSNDLAGFETYFFNLIKRQLELLDQRRDKSSVSQSDYLLKEKSLEEAKIESIIGYDSRSTQSWSRYLIALGYIYL